MAKPGDETMNHHEHAHHEHGEAARQMAGSPVVPKEKDPVCGTDVPAAAMAMSSVSVIGNALRLRRARV